MNSLKLVIVVILVMVFTGLLTGIESIVISTDGGTEIRQFTSTLKKLLYIFVFVICAIWIYLIHKQKILAWWIGTVVFIIAFIDTAYLAVIAVICQIGSQRMLNSFANLFLSIAIYLLFVKWWLKAKRLHFNK